MVDRRYVSTLTRVFLVFVMALFSKNLIAAQQATANLPRQIDFSGVVVQFSLPENFSSDMPAHDMIEAIDLADAAVFADPARFTVLRRFWDFHQGRWLFRRNIGTVMMSVMVKQVGDGKSLTDAASFVAVIQQELVRVYGEGAMTVDWATGEEVRDGTVYLPSASDYYVREYAGQPWIMHPLAGDRIAYDYYIPLTSGHYLLVDFELMPANDVNSRDFEAHVSGFIEDVMATFYVNYPAQNPVPTSFPETVKQLEAASR